MNCDIRLNLPTFLYVFQFTEQKTCATCNKNALGHTTYKNPSLISTLNLLRAYTTTLSISYRQEIYKSKVSTMSTSLLLNGTKRTKNVRESKLNFLCAAHYSVCSHTSYFDLTVSSKKILNERVLPTNIARSEPYTDNYRYHLCVLSSQYIIWTKIDYFISIKTFYL